MSFLRTCLYATPIGLLVLACSGSDATVGEGTGDASTDGSGGGGDGATDASGSGDGSGTGDGAASGDGATSGDASASDAAGGDARGDAAACPDEHGKYSVVATGLGCGDLAVTASQCIMQTACAITFSSSGSNGTKALNGDANLMSDGSFSGASIKEGNVNRTGCVGSWDANTSTLTVDCGGTGTTQSCRAVLTRTATNCT
jgi:hypothetical protein